MPIHFLLFIVVFFASCGTSVWAVTAVNMRSRADVPSGEKVDDCAAKETGLLTFGESLFETGDRRLELESPVSEKLVDEELQNLCPGKKLPKVLKLSYKPGELRKMCDNFYSHDDFFDTNRPTNIDARPACVGDLQVLDEAKLADLASKFKDGSPLATVTVDIPHGESFISYTLQKKFDGQHGASSGGVYELELKPVKGEDGKVEESPLPEKLVLKVALFPENVEGEYKYEAQCTASVGELSGYSHLYGTAFRLDGDKGTCYKGLVINFLEGSTWSAQMAKSSEIDTAWGQAMSQEKECSLQESAFKKLCGMTQESGQSGEFADLDNNNPGNWQQLASGDWVALDFGVCFRKPKKDERPQTGTSIYGDVANTWVNVENVMTKSPIDQGVQTCAAMKKGFGEGYFKKFVEEYCPDASVESLDIETIKKIRIMAEVSEKLLDSALEDSMWHPELYAKLQGFNMGVGDLILNSQKRIQAMQLAESGGSGQGPTIEQPSVLGGPDGPKNPFATDGLNKSKKPAVPKNLSVTSVEALPVKGGSNGPKNPSVTKPGEALPVKGASNAPKNPSVTSGEALPMKDGHDGLKNPSVTKSGEAVPDTDGSNTSKESCEREGERLLDEMRASDAEVKKEADNKSGSRGFAQAASLLAGILALLSTKAATMQ